MNIYFGDSRIVNNEKKNIQCSYYSEGYGILIQLAIKQK